MNYLLKAIRNKLLFSLILFIASLLLASGAVLNWHETHTTFGFVTWTFFLGLATTTSYALGSTLRIEIIRIRENEENMSS